MGARARSLLIWILAAALTVQLILAGGHIHAHQETGFGHTFAVNETRCHGPSSDHDTHDDVCESSSDGISTADAHQPRIAHAAPNGHDDDPIDHDVECELCWVLSILTLLVLAALTYCLLAVRVSAKLSFADSLQFAGAFTDELYRARAPPR